ncbi:MAG: sporulation protein YunB [Clostridiales bacterium]|nr:sporulation protein YunB [Clostridiales bacterium]
MKHRRRKPSFWILLTLLAFLLVIAVACYQLRPLTESLTIARVDNAVSRMLNLAIAEEIEAGEIDYDRIVYLEKDTAGNITALKTNMAEINRLKTSILTTMDDQLYDISIEDIGIPIGSLLFPDLLYGRGPKLPVRIISCSTSSAEFRNQFTAAGINQTLHQIVLDVTATISVMLPTGSLDIDIDSEVIVAETIIVGTVPDHYVNFDGATDAGSAAEDYFTYVE